jgi:hypothetical protein
VSLSFSFSFPFPRHIPINGPIFGNPRAPLFLRV